MRLGEPARALPGMRDDDDLVGTEVTKLVLDRHERIGVADLPLRGEALLDRPRERRLESLVRFLALAVDVRRPAMRPRGHDRHEHVELDVGSAGHQLAAELLTGQRLADHHEDVALPARCAMRMGSVRRLLERRPAAWSRPASSKVTPAAMPAAKNTTPYARERASRPRPPPRNQPQRHRNPKGVGLGLERDPHEGSGTDSGRSSAPGARTRRRCSPPSAAGVRQRPRPRSAASSYLGNGALSPALVLVAVGLVGEARGAAPRRAPGGRGPAGRRAHRAGVVQRGPDEQPSCDLHLGLPLDSRGRGAHHSIARGSPATTAPL